MGHNQKDSRQDTIVALATAIGRSGIGIIRVSGSLASIIAKKILKRTPKIRVAELLKFYDSKDNVIDKGIVLFFQNPESFTGEDILELQAHGGPVLLDMLMSEIISLGARAARPGEFSERAFLNAKIDLAQAEAIADMIDAASTEAVRYAGKSLDGEFSKRIQALVKDIIKLRVFVEAEIDFPEEDIDFIKNSDMSERLLAIVEKVDEILVKAKAGSLLREGMTLVLAGKPNAGKSSLLNLLAGRNSAIVTDIPGTTRDVLKEYIQIDGMPLHILDTAGLRETNNEIEQEGVKRAWQEIEKADSLLLVVDDNKGLSQEDKKIIEKVKNDLPVTILLNKVDLSGRQIGETKIDDMEAIAISAKTGEGLGVLSTRLKNQMGYTRMEEGVFMARRRHLEALNLARKYMIQAIKSLKNAPELTAEDLRKAQEGLSSITGEFGADDLLGKIFSDFCIGK